MKRSKLIPELLNLVLMILQRQSQAWIRSIQDAVAKIRRVRVEYCDAVATDKAGNVSQVVDGVEAESEATDLVSLTLFRCSAQLANVLEIVVRKDGVVVNLHCKNHIYFCIP